MYNTLFNKYDLTLSFEVIHKDDPHIIKYNDDERGLYLIGARGKNENSINVTEEELDRIGGILGLRRAKHEIKTFGEVKNENVTTQTEGFIVRDIDDVQTPILKLKSPFYLTTKFLGRMGQKQIKFMFILL